MELHPVQAKAPASIMLFGEHSVLRGGHAILCAIENYITVKITPQNNNTIHIISSFGEEKTDKDAISLSHPLRFISESLHLFKKNYSLPSGMIIEVISEIDPTVGLGSSASLTVALLSALYASAQQPIEKKQLLQKCYTVIHNVQKVGSGADAASIIYGGVIAYTMHNSCVTPLENSFQIALVYSGSKTPTQKVIEFVNENEKRYPKLFSKIFSSIEQATLDAISAINNKDLFSIGSIMNISHGLMESLLVGTQELANVRHQLLQETSIYGAKISGSGLGDSVVALGTVSDNFKEKLLPSKISQQGVIVTRL